MRVITITKILLIIFSILLSSLISISFISSIELGLPIDQPNQTNNDTPSCINNLTTILISDWSNLTCLQNNSLKQLRTLLKYDINHCGNIENQTINEFREGICDYCIPKLVNSTYSSWANVSCQINDKMKQIRSKVEYDSNNCGEIDTNTIIETREELSCDYCKPLIVDFNTSCQKLDKFTQMFRDKNLCYSKTGLVSDNIVPPMKNWTCDYCKPNIVDTNSSCQNTDKILQSYEDKNQCFSKTGLASDNIVPPMKNWTCDYCKPNIVNWNSSCSTNDSFMQYFKDSNDCFLKTKLQTDNIVPENKSGVCNYCTQNISDVLYTPWSSCLNNDTSTRIKYYVDSNYESCCLKTGLASDCEIKTEKYKNITEIKSCNYCSSNIDGPFFSSWSLCMKNNKSERIKYFSDSNYESCCKITGLLSDCEFNLQKYMNITEMHHCDFCSFNPVKSYSEWQQQKKCANDDEMVFNRSVLEYDSNYENCYLTTKLLSDLWNNGNNKSYIEYDIRKCDYCIPNQTFMHTEWNNLSCLINDKMNQTRNKIDYDSNNCYHQTKLASDMWGNSNKDKIITPELRQELNCDFCKPEILTGNKSCTVNDDFIEWFSDKNNCFIITKLESDNVVPINKTWDCNYCSIKVVNSSLSQWKDLTTCRINDTKIQNRFKIEYDINYDKCYLKTKLNSDLWNNGINKTHYENKEIECNYCSEKITGPYYTEWSSCAYSTISTRIKYYKDVNYDSCCNITGKDSDCRIKTTFKNVTESYICNMTISSPAIGNIYNINKLPLTINTKFDVTRLEMVDYSTNKPLKLTLCTEDRNTQCENFNKELIFSPGNHTLSIVAFTKDGKSQSLNTNFFIDSKEATTSIIEPKAQSYTNGKIFSVSYSEENLESITLYYGNERIVKKDCLKGKNQKCSFELNLSKYNNQEIIFYFEIKDLAGNIKTTKKTNVKVDTVKPLITNPESLFTYNGINVYFKINVNEKNFQAIEYLDSLDGTNAKYKQLCSTLDTKGRCERMIGFKRGSHNVKIKVLDKAGNYITQDINFISN
ncbi:MAG: hypothetical protein WC867_06770 [Candidatus Pacearchaeota archaeon]|jgi:hypothetical protein